MQLTWFHSENYGLFTALPREPMVAARAALAHCVNQPAVPFTARNLLLGIPLIQLGSHPTVPAASFVQPETPKCKEDPAIHPVMLMPPPPSTVLPPVRLQSQSMGTILDGNLELKREVETPPSENATPDLSISQAAIRQFVSSTPLPSLSVENFLSNIESTTTTASSRVPITSQKLYGDAPSMTASEQMASLKTQLAVSMANEAQVVSKLDAFVKSNAEAQLSPNGEVQATLQEAPGELILSVPQQTSPLNLQTHDNIVASLNPPHLIMEQKIQTTQNEICNILSDSSPQSQTLAMPSQMINNSLSPEPTSEMLINPNFSPGKKLLVTNGMSMNVDQLTGSEFTEMDGSSAAPTTNNLLLKVDQVIKDLDQSSQFSSPAIHSTIEPSSQVSQMVSPGYMNNRTDLLQNSFLPSQPMHLERENVIQNDLQGLSSREFNDAMISTCVPESQPMNADTSSLDGSSGTSESNMIVDKSPSYGGGGTIAIDNHYSSPVMSLPIGSADVKTLRTEVDSNFTSNLVFTSADKIAVVTTQQMSLGTPSFSNVPNGNDLNNSQFTSTAFQPSLNQQENAHQPPLINTQAPSNIALPSDSGDLTARRTESSYQNCSLVNSFTQQPQTTTPPTTTRFISVPPSSAASTDKDQSREKTTAAATGATSTQQVKKCEDGMPLPHELTNMSDHDLLNYINPSCFDTV